VVTTHGQTLDFDAAFRALEAAHRPALKWQTRLHERLMRGDVPGVCRLPTGLGKTSVIPIWLIALCGGARLPRRLVYIVNRRTVVDQASDQAKRLLGCIYMSGQRDRLPWATEEAIAALGLGGESMPADGHASALATLREALARLSGDDAAAPLAVSTLRGELADNGEWKQNPARPAIIVGTIDMIGSKLLFSGYGDGRYGRAHHAGLIGQDALVVHDEAHLSPAFDELLTSICREQRRCKERCPTSEKWSIRVMRLSATARPDRLIGAAGGGAGDTSPASASDTAAGLFELTPEDERDEIVSQRLHARKHLTIKEVSGSVGAAAAEQPDAAGAAGEPSAEGGRKAKRKKAKADLASTIASAAFAHNFEKCRVLVYVRTPDLAKQVSERLAEQLDLTPIKEEKDEAAEQRAERERKNIEREETLKDRVRVLTGTIRGHERDALAGSELFLAFKSGADRSKPLTHTMYLVSTSAGEVGADLDADHLVCDLTTLDSMAQRFGRVNRMGGEGRSARIVVVTGGAAASRTEDAGDDEDAEESAGAEGGRPAGGRKKAVNAYDAAAGKTGEILSRIAADGGDVSPAALSALLAKPEAQDAFSPTPTILPATDILFDHWSLTSIAGEMPGRPEVGPYLHGVAEWDPPETYVAWRADIALLAGAGGADDDGRPVPCSRDDLAEVFDAFPLRSVETLRDRTDRVQEQLQAMAERLIEPGTGAGVPLAAGEEVGAEAGSEAEGQVEPDDRGEDTPVPPATLPADPWVVLMRGGSVEWVRLSEIAPADKEEAERAQRRLAFATVVLPVEAGGLTDGMLAGEEPAPKDARSLDVAEAARDGARARQRLVDDRPLLGGDGIAGVARAIVSLSPAGDDDAEQSMLEYRVAQGQEHGPGVRVRLDRHHDAVASAAERMGRALGLDEALVEALRLAGRWHDAGKSRAVWQRYAGNWDENQMRLRDGHPIAKSDRYGHWRMLGGYRHEFGSLHDASTEDDLRSLDPDARDLVLHLIAAHHGWARPHFEPRHFDPGEPPWAGGRPRPTADNERLAVEVMQRFGRLQRRCGRWGLAWLESILRCADAAASGSPTPDDPGGRTGSTREGARGGAA
jgi:CRISPR-associated endonuclease/helicase Cas3